MNSGTALFVPGGVTYAPTENRKTAHPRGERLEEKPSVGEAATNAALGDKTVVAPHRELRFKLLQRFERHPHDNQQAGAAELEGVDACCPLHDLRNQGENHQENRPPEAEATADAAQEIGGGRTGSNARDKPTGLPQLLADALGIELHAVV